MAKAAEEFGDDFQASVLRARRALSASGELNSQSGPTALPITDEERAVLVELRRDGTYKQAAAEVAASDPDLAD